MTAPDSCLVGDLGGTHLRLGLYTPDGLRRARVQRWEETPSLVAAVRGFLGEDAPLGACFAVAAPVTGPRVHLTNARVDFCADQLRDELRLLRLEIVNDVAALARSVSDLVDHEAAVLGGGSLRRDRTIAVVAPGTGLGVAALLPTRHGPVVVSGEGGHIPLPATRLGLPVAGALLDVVGHVSAEDLLCGRGLPVLDLLLRKLSGEQQPTPRTAAEVTAAGDVEVFVDLLAAVVQSHALTLGATGGVVLSGGILCKLIPLLRANRFYERFVTHPRMSQYLAAIPVVVDTRDHPALVGAARFLEDLA